MNLCNYLAFEEGREGRRERMRAESNREEDEGRKGGGREEGRGERR